LQEGFNQFRLPFGKPQCAFDFVVYFLFQLFLLFALRILLIRHKLKTFLSPHVTEPPLAEVDP
jgi:hypothetical protein